LDNTVVTLERALGHHFAEPALLRRALTHPSVDRASAQGGDYDRLEFLGDRVLGLVIAARLHERDARAEAGELAVRFNALVRKETVAEVARALDLGAYVRVSPGERAQGGADKDAILADACEALIGAVFLDAGFEAAAAVIDRHWASRLQRSAEADKDAKTRLQEWVQARDGALPRYEIVARSGPEHAPTFTIAVHIDDHAAVTGQGNSRRAAEQDAALRLLAEIASGHGR
jgi:ribonuclease-3